MNADLVCLHTLENVVNDGIHLIGRVAGTVSVIQLLCLLAVDMDIHIRIHNLIFHMPFFIILVSSDDIDVIILQYRQNVLANINDINRLNFIYRRFSVSSTISIFCWYSKVICILNNVEKLLVPQKIPHYRFFSIVGFSFISSFLLLTVDFRSNNTGDLFLFPHLTAVFAFQVFPFFLFRFADKAGNFCGLFIFVKGDHNHIRLVHQFPLTA